MKSAIVRRMQALVLAAAIIPATPVMFAQLQQPTQQAPAQQANQQPQDQTQAAPAAPPQICGNTAFCYETNDFAATITSFRITTDAAKRQILDLSVRFQNKTAQQLVLGYVNGSGNASDDRGNRLVPWGPNANRGLGLVYGATFDPKFVVRPAGVGDAQFEFYPQGYPQVVGFTYTLDLTIAEINTFEGNQHTLGEEFPLHFQGLRNGSASISPVFSPGAAVGQASSYAQGGMGNAMSNPCATAGSLSQGAGQVAGQAASTVSNAATAISNLGSMFHHKKTQNAGQAAASAVGCDPNAVAGVPAPATVMNATGATTTTTNPLQQAVSRKAVQPVTATAAQPVTATNPLNPLASAPAQANSTPQASAAKTATTNTANAQVAAAARTSATAAAATTAKPATPAKPTPAKSVKPQPQKSANAPAAQN